MNQKVEITYSSDIVELYFMKRIRVVKQRGRSSSELQLRDRWSYTTYKVRGSGREEMPHVQGQGQRPRGDAPCPWKGAAATLCWSSCEEIIHVQGKRNASKTLG